MNLILTNEFKRYSSSLNHLEIERARANKTTTQNNSKQKEYKKKSSFARNFSKAMYYASCAEIFKYFYANVKKSQVQ